MKGALIFNYNSGGRLAGWPGTVLEQKGLNLIQGFTWAFGFASIH